MPNTEPEIKNPIVFDEVNATLNRVKIIQENCSDPVEVFLAIQVGAVLNNVLADLTRTLQNPALETTAKEFMKAMQEDLGKENDLPK